MIDLFDIVLVKHTGLSGYATEVNSISFKTVDSATWLDSIDSLNYPVRAPYGTKPKSLSYENWIKFKLRFDRRSRKFVDGTVLHLPPSDCEGCENDYTFTKVKNLRLWIRFKCTEAYDIHFGFSDTYVKPVKTPSVVATTNIKTIESTRFEEEYSIELPLGNSEVIPLGLIEELETPFFVTQLTAYKGCQFQNSIVSVEVHYELA